MNILHFPSRPPDPEKRIKVRSFRLSPELDEELAREARREGVTFSSLICTIAERHCEVHRLSGLRGSHPVLDLARHVMSHAKHALEDGSIDHIEGHRLVGLCLDLCNLIRTEMGGRAA